MADYATKEDVEKIVGQAVNSAVDGLSGIIQTFAKNVDERFDALERRVTNIEQNIDRLTNTLDAFVKRLDDIETDNTARDARLARLERWIEQVAKKSGVKLEY